jgi:peptide/nickel transport system substrate-binding protein
MKYLLAVAAVALTLLAGATDAAAEKILTYHLTAAPDSLDPAKCNNQRCRRVMWPIFESLVNLSKDRTITPGLAESWDVSADALTYTFRLRRGVRFHDGTPFTAAAAKLNLERNFLPGSAHYSATPPNVREKVLAGLIREIVAVDAHTLTLRLRTPQVQLLFLIPIVSPHALARFGSDIARHPIGTGPFVFTRQNKDEVVLSANTNYWGGRPKLDRLVFRVISDAERTMDEFLAGRLDFIPEVEPVYLERVVADPGARVARVPTLSTYYLGFRTDLAPLTNVRVRQGIARALNTQRSVLFVARGLAVPAFGPIPPGAEAHDPDLKTLTSYDPEAARRLLREGGWKPETSLSLAFNGGWGFMAELAHAIKSDLAKVDVSVQLAPQASWTEVVSAARQGSAELFLYGWLTLLSDAEVWLTPLFQSHAVDNLTRYRNPAVDALLQQARGLADRGAREDLYQRAQRLIVQDAPMAFLYHEVRVSAYRSRLVGVDLNVESWPVDRFARIDVP